MSDKIEPMRIGASVAVSVLRLAWQKHTADVPRGKAYDGLRAKREQRARFEVFEVRDECIPLLSDEQAIAIARGDATLRGWSHLGLTYHGAPDDVVGEYIPERDDSAREGWVQPEWRNEGPSPMSAAPDGSVWICTVGKYNAAGWTAEQWSNYVRVGEPLREFVHIGAIPEIAPEVVAEWSAALDRDVVNAALQQSRDITTAHGEPEQCLDCGAEQPHHCDTVAAADAEPAALTLEGLLEGIKNEGES